MVAVEGTLESKVHDALFARHFTRHAKLPLVQVGTS